MKYEYREFTNEKQLFEFVKNNFMPDLVSTYKNNGKIDCHSDEYMLSVELKCRRKHYSELLLERKKYNSMIERSKLLKTKPVYINSTPLGVWAFYLDNYKFDWEERSLPRNTAWSNTGWMKKQVTYLNIDQGVDLLSLLPS